jgi:hypothetical protein
VQLSFDFYMIETKPENLIGAKAYDSDPLDKELRREGVEVIAPHDSERKRGTPDGRRLRGWQLRGIVGRFFFDPVASSIAGPLGVLSTPLTPFFRVLR